MALLVQSQASLDWQVDGLGGTTALMRGAAAGHLAVVQQLLDARASTTRADSNGGKLLLILAAVRTV